MEANVRVYRWGSTGPVIKVRVFAKARPKRRRKPRPVALTGWTLRVWRQPKQRQAARPVRAPRQSPPLAVRVEIVAPEDEDRLLRALARYLVRRLRRSRLPADERADRLQARRNEATPTGASNTDRGLTQS